MRNEREMFDLILGVAEQDDRIRAVYMNGSRTNPNIPKDIFQDYDIVYVVTETESFIEEENWIQVFGDLLMLQEPEKLDKALGRDVDLSQNYGYLMLFTDGNRIDLHIQTKEFMLEAYRQDSLTIPMLDKDNCLPQIPPATDRDYWVKLPTEAEYFSCCNDFWWCLQNVAKGIWRDELPYVKQMFEVVIRPNLDKIVNWWIGMNHDFQVSPGKMGKYYQRFLTKEYWEMYKETYANADYDSMWQSIFVTCDLFQYLSKEIAKKLSLTYIEKDAISMRKYLEKVRDLHPNAKVIF